MIRALLSGVVILLAFIVQICAVNLVPVPTPDLVLLTVVAVAVLAGPLEGAAYGFAAGLLTDVAPPAHHVIGLGALVFCLVGYVSGRLAGRGTVVAVLIGCLAGTLLYSAAEAMLAGARTTLPSFGRVLPVVAAVNVVAAPVVMWLVARAVPRRHP